jgi:hypothetical protein
VRDESGSVTIGNIERYISDQALAMGWKPDMTGVSRWINGSPLSAQGLPGSPAQMCWCAAV